MVDESFDNKDNKSILNEKNEKVDDENIIEKANQEMSEERLKKMIIEALKKVIDPELGYNVVDLGLIYEVNVNLEEKKINVKMGLTTPFCPLAGPILGSAYEAVASIDYILKNKFDVNIEYDFERQWTPDLMKPELREQLGL